MLICNCTLAGTKACFNCPQYIDNTLAQYNYDREYYEFIEWVEDYVVETRSTKGTGE